MDNYISITGAKVNNLKNISLKIPRDKLVVVSGISGSGKSSLAFDTIFAEGQRRFVESLSSFARQFLGRMSKPDVELISGIPPAIAIEQKVNSRNPRSTVGTNTEIYDYLRLLYSKIGKTYSPVTGREVKRDSTQDVLEYIAKLQIGTVVYLLAPFGWENRVNRIEKLLYLKEEGFTRLYDNGKIIKIDSALKEKLETYQNLYLLIDRIIVEEGDESNSRISDSLNTAFSIDRGDGITGTVLIATESNLYDPIRFSSHFEADGIEFMEPEELLFSYNNPIGACPECGGYGKIIGIDENLVVPDNNLSVYQEAIACWRGDTMKEFYNELILNASNFNFPIHKPFIELNQEQIQLLWKGNEYFTGLNKFFEIIESNRYKIQYKYLLHRYSGKTICPVCSGTRLRKEALYVKINGYTISQLLEMTSGELYDFFQKIELTEYQENVSKRIIKEIKGRLICLIEVGLSYLTMNRASNTLSGGESQRINLVSSIGSSLVGSLYILDEPSIGLHPRDTSKLIVVLKRLRDLGNSVIVVEHDEEIIRSSDELIDIGPMAGRHGGRLVFQGNINENISADYKGDSLTLKYISGLEKIETPPNRRQWINSIMVEGAMENNLKDISVKFPLKVITAVTGVSGSGKSTLVKDILYPALYRHLNQTGDKPGKFRKLSGDLNKITSVEYIDQNPIGKSSRSNPATYLKVYDEIRKLFSDQPYAKVNGYGHSHFSFNIDGGRCPECQGEGIITIEMQFMADVQMVCESCSGKRFKQDILEVRYHEKNINDILNMSVQEAVEFFSGRKEPIANRIVDKLKPLMDVGLSYVQLGQSSSTLSGGESQRVKLASFLGKDKNSDSILFIFDEPTTGLHFHDIKKLLSSFSALIDRGHTIVVVEHNMDVVKCADWVIDLGPEGGEDGGSVVFAGTPDLLKGFKGSYTGDALLRF